MYQLCRRPSVLDLSRLGDFDYDFVGLSRITPCGWLLFEIRKRYLVLLDVVVATL